MKDTCIQILNPRMFLVRSKDGSYYLQSKPKSNFFVVCEIFRPFGFITKLADTHPVPTDANGLPIGEIIKNDRRKQIRSK